VIDASDPYVSERINVVHEILQEIGAHQPKILVFNKIDLIDAEKKAELAQLFPDFDKVFISVKETRGLEDLRKLLMKYV
jgi:50S ribosomal subunit-associated GTPase HflX